jgi:hypothetical protein
MFLRCITIKGVTRLYFYESHFCDGKSKQTCVECLGRLDELQKQFQDPVAHFKKVAEERTKELKNASTTTTTIDLLETMEVGEDDVKNVGYVVLKDLYKELELDKFWKRILAKTSNDAPRGKPSSVFIVLRILSNSLNIQTLASQPCFARL